MVANGFKYKNTLRNFLDLCFMVLLSFEDDVIGGLSFVVLEGINLI